MPEIKQTPAQAPNTPTTGKKAAWVAIALTIIAGSEGLRTKAYEDPVGIPTICFGETKGVKMGDTATVAQCTAMLGNRLAEFDQMLQNCAGKDLVERMPAQSRAAYNSFIYNVGPGGKGVKDGFCALKSNGQPSSMLRYLKAGQYEKSCQEFKNWANPAWLRGLKIRRDEEMALCMQGVPLWANTRLDGLAKQ